MPAVKTRQPAKSKTKTKPKTAKNTKTTRSSRTKKAVPTKAARSTTKAPAATTSARSKTKTKTKSTATATASKTSKTVKTGKNAKPTWVSKPTKGKGRKRVFGEIGGENEQSWRTYAKTRNPELRNKLMELYLPVVQFIAERLLLTLPRSIEVDDLKSAGVFGLMDAIDGFDIDRGIKFKTYCSTRVRGAILDELRSQDWVPRLVRLRAHQLTRTQASLEAMHGRLPTDAEMADELNVSVFDYIAMTEEARAHTVRSLSESWDDGSGDQPVEKIDFLRDPSSPDPADVLNQEDVMKAIIRSLNRREKEIILMYYRDGLTMKQIGNLMGLTESRVCQIHSNVMKKLKVHLEECHDQLSM
jgi:RNA polymerase sigma factor for flagellar operon FliA